MCALCVCCMLENNTKHIKPKINTLNMLTMFSFQCFQSSRHNKCSKAMECKWRQISGFVCEIPIRPIRKWLDAMCVCVCHLCVFFLPLQMDRFGVWIRSEPEEMMISMHSHMHIDIYIHQDKLWNVIFFFLFHFFGFLFASDMKCICILYFPI